jgi:hypothetical protein
LESGFITSPDYPPSLVYTQISVGRVSGIRKILDRFMLQEIDRIVSKAIGSITGLKDFSSPPGYDFVERNFILPAVIKLRWPGRFIVGDALTGFKGARNE